PPLPQPPVAVGSAAIAALRQAQAEAARATIPAPPRQQGVPIPQPPPPWSPVAVGSAAIAALRQQADAANQQLMNITVQRRQWENSRVPSLPAFPPPPAPALRRPAMPPPLPDQLPPFDPRFASLPPPQQQLIIDDRNHPDGFLARTPNQPHAPHLDIRIKAHYLGRMNVECERCNALHWLEERVLYMGSKLNPKFGLCCDHGRVKLSPPLSPPLDLLDLFKDDSSVGKEFRENIRRYNAAFAFISLGCKLNDHMEQGGGPYSFQVDEPSDSPSYAQLYFYDPLEALEHCMANVHNRNLNRYTMQALQTILTNCNPYVQLYKSAREILEEQSDHSHLTLRLHFDATKDQRRYNAPTSSEVAALLLGPADQPYNRRDIILYLRGGGLRRIDEGSPYYTPLHYVLLFPRGDFGWHHSMRLQPGEYCRHHQSREEEEEGVENENDSENEREGHQANQGKLTCARFHAYKLHIKPEDKVQGLLHWGGRLLQQYVVDAWAQIE
ncbi:hypothetical protein M422DRAFT_258746, partial [Sphaerobolus stellatus SS14]